jgi:UDP:flavonoid glycosyltransferase YjiC (YdhE family)
VNGGAMRKHLFVILSTHGHIFPAIKFAHSLQRGGHDVLFVTANEYLCLLAVYGLRCIGVTNSPHYFLSTIDWYTEEANRNQVRVIADIVESYRPDAIVTNPLALSAFIIAERYAIETTVIGYCEYLYPEVATDHATKQWRINVVTEYYNRVRRMFDLAEIPVDRVNSPLIGDRYLLRSIPQFHDYEELPSQVEYVGGLYWEPDYVNVGLDAFVAESRRDNRALLYVQIGRLFEKGDAWSRLVDGLKDLPVGCVVDTGRADYFGTGFERPPHFYFDSFIPIGHVKDAVDAVICSGQSTSVISAILHGKQLICMPYSDDSRELTARVERKGIGVGIDAGSDLGRDRIAACFDRVRNDTFTENVVAYQQLFLQWEKSYPLLAQ